MDFRAWRTSSPQSMVTRYVCAQMCVCIYVYVEDEFASIDGDEVCAHLCVFVCVCVCVCLCVFMYACTCM